MKSIYLILLFNFSILICKKKILEDYEEEKKDFLFMYKKFFVHTNNKKLPKKEIAESFFKIIKKNELKDYLNSIKKIKRTIKKIKKEIEPSYFNKKNIIIMTLMSCAIIILPIFFCFFPFNKKDKKVSTKKLLKLKNEFNKNYNNFFKAKKELYNQIYNYTQNDQNFSLNEKEKFVKLIEKVKEKNQIKNLKNIKFKINKKIEENKKKEL